jgi:site-specific recombinase XerD
MLRIRYHVNWHTVLLQPADGPSIEAYVISLPPDITKGGKTTGKPETVYAATARFRQVLEARRFALEKNPPSRQFIFGAEDGRPQKNFAKRWRELFGLAGLDYGRQKGLVWHSIRHEFISRLAELTRDPVLVQKLARHRQLQTTTLYFHTRRDRELAAAASLERRG